MTQHALDHLRAIHARGPLRAEAAHAAAGLNGFNRWLAVQVTAWVGSMWCAYVFAVLALLSLPAVLTSGGFVPPHFFPQWLINVGLIALVAWIAQTFLQLVLLSIILVGQRVQSEGSDKLSETNHEILGHEVEVLASLHGIVTEVRAINERQTEMLTAVHARIFPQTTTATGGATNTLPPAT